VKKVWRENSATYLPSAKQTKFGESGIKIKFENLFGNVARVYAKKLQIRLATSHARVFVRTKMRKFVWQRRTSVCAKKCANSFGNVARVFVHMYKNAQIRLATSHVCLCAQKTVNS
jgi:hypothetical protein